MISALRALIEKYGDLNVRVTDGEAVVEAVLVYDEDSGDVVVDMTHEDALVVE